MNFDDDNLNENDFNEYNDNEYDDYNGDLENTSSDAHKQEMSYQMKTWIVMGISAVSAFILVYFLCFFLLGGFNKKEVVEEDTNKPITKVETYEAYTPGQLVTLKDGTKWNVMYKSSENSKTVTLLSVDDINDKKILYDDATSYIKGPYLNNLLTSLEAETSDIEEVRLLSYLDIATVTETSSENYLPDVEVKEFNIPTWMSDTTTVTDTTYSVTGEKKEERYVMMICSKKDDKEARFCTGDAENEHPIRPIIVISKSLIEGSEKVTGTETEDKTTNGGAAANVNGVLNSTETTVKVGE